METGEAPQTTDPHSSHPQNVVNFFEETSVRIREIIAILLLVVLGDLTIYRSEGYTGFAVFLLLSPVLILVGRYRLRFSIATCLLVVMLVLLTAKLVWYGTALGAFAGTLLLFAFAFSLLGNFPYLHQVFVYMMLVLPLGLFRLAHYNEAFSNSKAIRIFEVKFLNIAIPFIISLIFSVIFILANPDLVSFAWKNAEEFINGIWDYLFHFSATEFWFWFFIMWTSLGLMAPYVISKSKQSARYDPATNLKPAALFDAFRNSLVMVILIFAGYLVFEVRTLWFREFPDGFYYSGYAHQGAAWLTFALAVSTLILSLIFRGEILSDPRLPRLKMMAWIWSLENLLLAFAVYHRLYIYVGFNGMTRMRVVGLLGITAVVIGFLLVIWKIACHFRFSWLIKRQMLVPAFLIYLYAMTPVDVLTTKYNVQRILAGDPAPAVQISVHPMSPDALVCLRPLLKCENQIIRDGIRALLVNEFKSLEDNLARQKKNGWTAHQKAIHYAYRELKQDQKEPEKWAYLKKIKALRKFHDYAYQWY